MKTCKSINYTNAHEKCNNTIYINRKLIWFEINSKTILNFIFVWIVFLIFLLKKIVDRSFNDFPVGVLTTVSEQFE